MVKLALLALICLQPTDAGSTLDALQIDINEHDFVNAAAEQNNDEVPELAEALEAAQRSWDLHNQTHAKYSGSLLSFCHQMMQKHAPKLALNGEQVEAVLKADGPLRDALTEHMNHQDENAQFVEQRAGLLARAGEALHDKADAHTALLETTAKGKTPCVHLVENYYNIRLVDFDAAPFPINRQNCHHQCLSACKNAAMRGQRKFVIDHGEMRTMGISQREMNAMQGNQVGAKCDMEKYQPCQCVDATESSQNLRRVFRQYGMVDVSMNEQYTNVPESEFACMSQCRDTMGSGMKYEGVCFDELFG